MRKYRLVPKSPHELLSKWPKRKSSKARASVRGDVNRGNQREPAGTSGNPPEPTQTSQTHPPTLQPTALLKFNCRFVIREIFSPQANPLTHPTLLPGVPQALKSLNNFSPTHKTRKFKEREQCRWKNLFKSGHIGLQKTQEPAGGRPSPAPSTTSSLPIAGGYTGS